METRQRIMEAFTVVGECWVWNRGRDRDGYGRLWANGKAAQLAHRVSFEVFKGEIPYGLELDHTCQNRACVNPDHLEPVTHAINMKRQSPRTAKTHCKNGHERNARNTRETVRPNGRVHRACRICEASASRRYKSQSKSKESA